MTKAGLGLSEDVPVVGYVGRMTRDKGLTTLTESVRILRDSRTAIQVLLVGPEEPKGALYLALESSGLPASSVHWVGYVPDARPYLAVMDVLCLPTRREGFPNVVLELPCRAFQPWSRMSPVRETQSSTAAPDCFVPLMMVVHWPGHLAVS